MAKRARRPVDPSAPNAPAVEAAFASAPAIEVAEILDGELHLSSPGTERIDRG